MRGKSSRERLGSMNPGQDLVVTGYIGEAGTARIISEKRQELLGRFSPGFLDQSQENRNMTGGNLEQWEQFGATECETVGEGGIMAALWNLSGAYEVGIEFWLRQIPVRQKTIEICEFYDLNPYRLLSDGCVILVCDNGYHTMTRLKDAGIPAQVIGTVNRGLKREIYNGEGRGFLDRPQRDELYKVLKII
ncbi:MAG: AIR synthase [Clostridiaceae bacterium]|nr:AIR synthase [Clostridiaceae bacterium]